MYNIKMRIILWLCFCTMLLPANAEQVNAVWQKQGAVKEMYETPFGILYNISPSSGDGVLVPNELVRHSYRHKNGCDCESCIYRKRRVDGGVLEITIPKKQKNIFQKRFIVIDFKIRAWPAMEKSKTVNLAFSFLDSAHPIYNSSYPDLHGNLACLSRSLSVAYFTTGQSPVYSARISKGNGVVLRRNSQVGNMFPLPSFEPLSVRIIYDRTAKEISFEFNGEKSPQEHFQVKASELKIQHFGLAVFQDSENSEQGNRQKFFELSPPQVYGFDTAAEIKNLPPHSFHPYPYNHYFLKTAKTKNRTIPQESALSFNKIRNHANPDLQYAWGMRYLYGDEKVFDTAKALQLFEKAARKRHLPALYQLGLCYWRGYGVMPDENKAIRYLREARDYGLPEAGALLLLMETEKRGRPWFFSERYKKQLDQIPNNGSHDVDFLGRRGGFSVLTPKCLTNLIVTRYAVRKGVTPKEYYVDNRVRKGCSIGLLAKGLTLENTEGATFFQRAVSAGRSEAVPCWLYAKMMQGVFPTDKDLTVERKVLLADHPLWNLVSALSELKAPVQRGQYLQQQDDGTFRFTSLHNWEAAGTPEAEFLCAMRKMHQLENFNIRYLLSSPASQTKLKEVFTHLRKAAAGNHAGALYFLGRFYAFYDLPEPYFSQEQNDYSRIHKAQKYLSEAFRQGHPGAAVLLARLEVSGKNTNWNKVLQYVKPLEDFHIAESFYYQTLAYYKTGQFKSAEKSAQQGIQAGEYRIWQLLALYDNRNTGVKNRSRYWRSFIGADRKKRGGDLFDFFWPRPYEEYLKWENAEKQEDSLNFAPKTATMQEDISPVKKQKNKKEKSRTRIKFRD